MPNFPKFKLYSVMIRALIRYLNKRNLIHGQETATISKFSALIFEIYFNQMNKRLFRGSGILQYGHNFLRKVYSFLESCTEHGQESIKLVDKVNRRITNMFQSNHSLERY